jgi:hypothetical protein
VISRDYRRAGYLGRCRDGRAAAQTKYPLVRATVTRAALLKEGGAGPDASPDAVKAAIETQRRPPQTELDKLKNI